MAITGAGAHAAPKGRRALLRRPVSRRRLVSWSAKIGVTLVAGLVLTGFAATHKTLTLTVDGQSTPVTSFGSSVASVLASEGVAISAHDVVVPALSEAVPRGGEIVVHTASAINVTIDGENRTVWTTAPTVDEALAELGVRAAESQLSVSRSTSVDRLNGVVSVSTPKVMAVMVDGIELEANTNAATVSQTLTEMGVVLGPDDVVSPPLDAATQLGQTITVDRAVVTNGSQIVTIPFEKVTQDDPDLEKGKTKVLQDGVAGERIITYVSTTAGTSELERTVVCDTLVRAPVDEVTAVGTKPPPPPKPKVTVPKVNLKVDPGSNQGIAKAMAAGSYGWGDDQFACLVSLWQRESGWNHTAANGGSGAYGIPQAYPGSKMASAGADWQTNPTTQISWGLGYIKGRYGNPCAAWGYFQSHNSY